MLRQHRPTGRANEIDTIPALLELLILEGCIVTIDAMGCQTAVPRAIIGAEADYVLRLKDNQKGLRSDVKRLFERQLDRDFELVTQTLTGDTGGSKPGAAGPSMWQEKAWSTKAGPGLQSVALVETERFFGKPQAEAGPTEGGIET